MYVVRVSPRFERDIKTCKKKHWNMDSLKKAISDLSASDKRRLAPRYKDHALTGQLTGFRSIHVDSAPNPPKDVWVLMYRIENNELHLIRTGTHQDVYG